MGIGAQVGVKQESTYGTAVTPDVFIPIDTSFANDYFFDVRQIVPQFAARWTESRDRSAFPGKVQDFVRSFSVSDEMLNELVAFAESHEVPRNDAELKQCRAELKLQIKARLAKILFQDEGLYAVLNDDDPAVEKALQVLKSGEPVAKR